MNLAALVALGALAAAANAAHADHENLPKKDQRRAHKHAKHRAPLASGTRPPKLYNLYNSWTHEWLAVTDAEKPPQAVLDRFLRDHYTNEPNKMEPRLLALIVGAAKNFGSDRAIVVSAFRHPKYNLILRKKGRQVARDSQHTHGNAVDFYIPNVPTMTLHDWAKAQAAGGVGLYLDSGFVHMDTGRVRYWNGE